MQLLVRFTFHHDPEEDRIRLLAEDADGVPTGWWLTRRLTANLLNNSQRWLTERYAEQLNVPAGARHEVFDMYQHQARDQFEQDQVMRKQRAVETTDPPRLLTQLDLTLLESGELVVTFFAAGKAAARATMSVEYYHQLLHILMLKAEALEWQLQASRPPVAQSIQ